MKREAPTREQATLVCRALGMRGELDDQQYEEFVAGWQAGEDARDNGQRAPLRTPEMLEDRTVWAWVSEPDPGHWEIRATGVRLAD